jgi:hypothetical protein
MHLQGKILLDCYMYVICVALEQKILVREGITLWSHHNNLIRPVLCSAKKQIRPSFLVLSCRHVVE